jgi:hypothetical protein
MKRILLLCAFFMGSLAFACDSPLHEMFHEAASLKSSGYHAEAADLLSDITGADICNFSPGEMRCYNSVAISQSSNSYSIAKWQCGYCPRYYISELPPPFCQGCRGHNFTRVPL